MSVSVSPIAHPIVPTPLVTCRADLLHVSHPRVVSRPKQANGSFTSSSTSLVSRPVAPMLHAVCPVAPSPLVYPHGTSRPEQANGSPPSSSTHLPSLSMLHSSSTRPLVTLPVAPSPLSHTHGISRSEQVDGSFNSPSKPLPSHSTVHTRSAGLLPPCWKRSRRCFMCGRTGKHRLNPRYCPRTFELLSKHLATFDANFCLVSFDGSPLPMTRHPGGVVAHLLSPRRCSRRTPHVLSHSVSESHPGFHSNPLHVPQVPHDCPICVPRSVPNPSRDTD